MSVSIDWGNKIINVPKAYLTLIQATPTEIRELNIDSFRYDLRALEASDEGVVFDYTHSHNAPVSVGGVTLARVVEIVNGYTITFEDGQYAVNITGGNSNIGDNVNVNQVSVRSANSAGLISNAQIEFSSFNGGVTIDVIDGFAGTTFPIGTEQAPVSNLTDAKLIASVRGFDKLYIKGDITFIATDNIDEYEIYGQNARKTVVILEAGASTEGTSFFDCTITGVLDGDTWINHCLVDTLAYIQGQIENSVLLDVITLAGSESVRLINCADGVPGINTLPVIDMDGSGRDVIITDYDGTIVIRNLTGPDIVEMSIGRGHIHILDTVTDGIFILHGIGTLDDESTGTTIYNDGLINRQLITESTWSYVSIDINEGSAGTAFPLGTPQSPVNNLADAKLIADAHNLETFHLHGDVTIDTDDFAGYQFESDSPLTGSVQLDDVDVTNCVFNNLTITGTASGAFAATNCQFTTGIINIEGNMDNCVFTGAFTVKTDTQLNMDRCSAVSQTGITVDLNGAGRLGCANYNGVITITNATDPTAFIAVTGNYICNLHSSCTTGTALVAGIGILNNYSTMTLIERTLPASVWEEVMAAHLTDGTTGKKLYDGGTGDTDAIAAAVWDEPIADHLNVGSTGEKLNEGSVDSATIALIADAVWDELLSEHGITGSAGESLYIAGRMAPEGGWMSTSTASEIKLVRDKLGDAGNLVAETIIDEQSISSSDSIVFTMYQMIFEVTGVWLASDTTHVGTNYYEGDNGAFDSHTGMITLHTALPSDNEDVSISYTYFKGLHDDVITQFLTEAKMYVKKYTRKTFDWTLAFADPADEETQIALWAAAALAAKRCLEALAAGDILQLGFNFRLGDLEIENMVRGGGFQVQAHIDMLNEDIEKKLAMLGRGMYFSTSTTKSFGRDFWNYRRQGATDRRSGVQ